MEETKVVIEAVNQTPLQIAEPLSKSVIDEMMELKSEIAQNTELLKQIKQLLEETSK